jgi:hypothetical protein
MMKAGHSHIQQLRQAVARMYLRYQADTLRHLPRCDRALLQLSFDETECLADVEGTFVNYNLESMIECSLPRRGVSAQSVFFWEGEFHEFA